MNENTYYPRREDDEVMIDMKNLLGHILIKWKLILLVATVCAVIGGIIGFVRSSKSNDVASAAGEDVVATAAEGLTEVKKSEAEQYCEQLKAYDHAIEEQKRLYDEAYLMNLDPNSAVGAHIWYMIDTELGNATSIFSDMLIDEDYRKISEALGTDKSKKYLKEAVTFWSDETMDTYDMDITRTDRMLGNIKNRYKLLLKVTVIAPNRDSCDKVVGIVKAAIQRETDNLVKYGVTIKCTLLDNRTYDTDVEERIITANQGKINTLGNLETNRGNFYNNVISRVEENEKAYIDALYSADTRENREDENENKNHVSWKSILKYMIVCIFLGSFVLVCSVTAVYVLGGKIHIAEEIRNIGIPILQTFTDKSNESFSVFMEEFKKKAEGGNKKVYIAIDKLSTKSLEYAQRIASETDGEVICYIGGLLPNASDMKRLLESDAVLILPVIEGTKRSSISTFVETCARNDIFIIGSAPII